MVGMLGVKVNCIITGPGGYRDGKNVYSAEDWELENHFGGRLGVKV